MRAFILLVACVSALALGGCATPSGRSPVRNLYEVKREMRRYVSSRRYEAEIEGVVAQAKACLEAQARAGGKLAIVLDIDETLVSNVGWLELNDWGVIKSGATNAVSGPCGLVEWIRLGRCEPIRPTLELVRLARARGVAVFLITARPETLREATEKNLRALGCEWTGLTLKPARLRVDSEADYKAPARQKIAADGYRIILNLGDQDSDLAGGFAERSFKLPNPFYFTP